MGQTFINFKRVRVRQYADQTHFLINKTGEKWLQKRQEWIISFSKNDKFFPERIFKN